MTVATVGVAKVGVAELGVAKKRWQKRGDKKEVVEKANGGRNSGVAKKGVTQGRIFEHWLCLSKL